MSNTYYIDTCTSCKDIDSALRSDESIWNFKESSHVGSWELAKEKLLGHGSFSQVYRVRDLRTGYRLALKKIKKSHIYDEVRKNQFLMEIKVHRIMTHPNIVRFIDCFDTVEHVCLLMEYCNSNTLDEYIKKNSTGICEEDTKRLVKQVLHAVHYMHKNSIIHCDIKPSNIFININDQNRMMLKLGDFGFCKTGEEKDSDVVCGTPNYMAPEIIEDGDYFFESDIWSVGILTYTLLVGRPPFQGATKNQTMDNVVNNPVIVPTNISKKALAFISTCLAKNPSHRSSAEVLLSYPFFD